MLQQGQPHFLSFEIATSSAWNSHVGDCRILIFAFSVLPVHSHHITLLIAMKFCNAIKQNRFSMLNKTSTSNAYKIWRLVMGTTCVITLTWCKPRIGFLFSHLLMCFVHSKTDCDALPISNSCWGFLVHSACQTICSLTLKLHKTSKCNPQLFLKLYISVCEQEHPS